MRRSLVVATSMATLIVSLGLNVSNAAADPAPSSSASGADLGATFSVGSSATAGRSAGDDDGGPGPGWGGELDTILRFSEVPLGTYVSGQYASAGILFSGDNPFTTMDGSNSTSPVLSGSPIFQGAIEGIFVNADGTPRTERGFSLDIGFIDDPGSVVVDAFAADGSLVVSVPADGIGIGNVEVSTPELDNVIASFIVHTVYAEAAGFAIDNLRFGGVASGTPLEDTYAALGDSFQSGEGAWDYENGTDVDEVNECHRSLNSYPHLLINDGYVDLKLNFRACSGAIMDDLDEQHGFGGPPWDDTLSQYDGLGLNTKLVTIGIVGNDLDFAGTIGGCIKQSAGLPLLSPWLYLLSCEATQGGGVSEKITELESGTIRDDLRHVYQTVREKAPYARVMVVSYPKFFDDGEFNPCTPIRVGDSHWMNKSTVRADKAIGDIAESVGFEFVNMDTVLEGHEQCSANPGINAIVGLGDSESFHPNIVGHRLMADRIEEQISTPVTPSFVIDEGQTVSRTVSVHGRSFAINVAWPGSDVETTLISPSGQRYERDSFDNAEHSNGPTFESYWIDSPEPGEWTVEMFGAVVSEGGEPVTFTYFDDPVPNVQPVARMSTSGEGLTYTFDASESFDADGAIEGYWWDFGDGTYGEGARVTHTFPVGHKYNVMLEATDDEGASDYALTSEAVGQDAAAEYSSPDAVYADQYFGSTTHLTNQATINGTVRVDGDLQCDSDVHLNGDVIVEGDVVLTNRCEITGNLFAGANVTMNSTTHVAGNVAAGGVVRFQSTATIGGSVAASGGFTSIDGKTVEQLQTLHAIGGSVSSGITLPTVAVDAPFESAFDANESTGWKQWLKSIALSNQAPSWSGPISGSPGCTMAPWASSVNGSVVNVATSRTIDARSALSGCSSVSLQQMTLNLSGDLTIVADGFSSVNGLTVNSGDGLAHKLRIIVPTDSIGSRTVQLSPNTVVHDPVTVAVVSPGQVIVGGGGSLPGVVHSGSFSSYGEVKVG